MNKLTDDQLRTLERKFWAETGVVEQGQRETIFDYVGFARAVLAASQEKMPTIHQLSDWWYAQEESVLGFNRVGDSEVSRVEHHDAIKIAIAALHDWASHWQSHPHPVSVSERPILKSDPFNDEEGRCWCGTKAFVDNTGDCPIEYPASWEFRVPTPEDDCVLPANTIPQPQTLK